MFLLSLTACFLSEPSKQPVVETPGATTAPIPQPTPSASQGPTPTDSKLVLTQGDTDLPPPIAAPQPKWNPQTPYKSRISAPPWPDPSVHPDQCSSMEDGGEVSPDGCVTADLKCGDRIVGHTIGGVKRYDGRFYQSKTCTPNFVDHDGGDERVYRFKMPVGESRAWITMYSPCADLSLAAIRHQSDTCPTISHSIRTCEMAPRPDLMTERVVLTAQSRHGEEPTWYVVVEGAKDAEGMFELVVQCHPGLGGPVPQN